MSLRRRRLGMTLGFFVLVCLFFSYRLHRPAVWLLTPPAQIGLWEAIETPLSSNLKEQLGDPKGVALEYRNPLDERLTCQLFAPRSFEAYREPWPLSTMTLTAQRQREPFGPGHPVRAWVLHNKTNDRRALVYAWLQDREGKTRLFGVSGVHQGSLDRLALGWQRLIEPEAPCLVRLIAVIPQADLRAAQTLRNMDEVARGIYRAAVAPKEDRP